MPKVPVKLVSWDDVVGWTRRLAERVRESGYKPDVVVAVARGGYVPARLLCDFLGVENLLSVQSQHWTEAAKAAEKALIKFGYRLDLRGARVLLVDDIADTGETLLLARRFIEENWGPGEVRIATMQWISSVCKFTPDYYVEEVRDWVWYQYPWTRLEDVTQFTARIVRESGKESWTFEELLAEFREWYGITVDEWYHRRAVEILVEQGLLRREGGRLVKVVQ